MAWTNTINIKGSTGATGADGVRWFSAAGIPTEEPGLTTVATAVAGDFYLNLTTLDVYLLS
jgi:glutamate synthase domain-containing protein 2